MIVHRRPSEWHRNPTTGIRTGVYNVRIPKETGIIVDECIKSSAAIIYKSLRDIKSSISRGLRVNIYQGQFPPNTETGPSHVLYGESYISTIDGFQVAYCLKEETLEIIIIGMSS